MNVILDIVKQHKQGRATGIYSVCSAHPLVIEASLQHALKQNTYALIEATSNQVNQDGGYTGMQPVDFRDLVLNIAKKMGFPCNKVILGGDHLGPNCWQEMSAEQAMSKSKVLIAQYVEAGFKKIHLDCSMSCSDDPIPLTDEIVAKRAATLCLVAENSWKKVGGEAPVYVVGTEVPVPGGATEDLNTLDVTSPDAAETTISAHRDAFIAQGLTNETWQRVIALVVQPGVEFDHYKVIDYKHEATTELSNFIVGQKHMIYEAHSTDYQTFTNLNHLVRDHFAILKVGPGVTFALREALWALDLIENEWLGKKQSSQLKMTMLNVMKENPNYWEPYYNSTDNKLTLDLQYSLSDRIRYYWAHPLVVEAFKKLSTNLDNNPPPLTLLSLYLPQQYLAIRQGEISATVKEIIIHHITIVLTQYSDACMADNT